MCLLKITSVDKFNSVLLQSYELPTTNQPFPVCSLAPTVTDYLYPSAKTPLSPEKPKTAGGKGFHALIHLFNKNLIHICYVHGT